MSLSAWPKFERPPAVAFVDVDGTLLAQTTTFLFARILYRQGWIRRSFLLRGLYYGLQHRFGRLDYGRLIGIGLSYIARIPVVELERIAYENFAEFVRPRLYEGVVDHMHALRREGTAIVLVSSSPGLVIQPLSIYLGCTDTLTTPVVIERGRMVRMGSGPPCYGDGKRYWAEEWCGRTTSGWKTRWRTPITGATEACCSKSVARSWCTHAGACCGWHVPGAGVSSGPAGPAAPTWSPIARRGANERKEHDTALAG